MCVRARARVCVCVCVGLVLMVGRDWFVGLRCGEDVGQDCCYWPGGGGRPFQELKGQIVASGVDARRSRNVAQDSMNLLLCCTCVLFGEIQRERADTYTHSLLLFKPQHIHTHTRARARAGTHIFALHTTNERPLLGKPE